MQEIKVKELIKLGSSIRYLVDVKYKMSDQHTANEPLGDGHVIDNINHVLNLVSELGLNGTIKSGAFGKLRALHNELQKESRKNTHIEIKQAEHLSEISRIIRGSLLSEGNNKLAYYLEHEELNSATSPGWPNDVTPHLVWNAPNNIRKLAYWLVGVSFAVGVAVGETGITVNVIESLIPATEEVTKNDTKGVTQQGASDIRKDNKADGQQTDQQ